MADDHPSVVIDTNILVSALVFGGKPEEILKLATSHRIKAITSSELLAELVGVLAKKFNFSAQRIKAVEEKLKQSLEIVVVSREITILGSADDRVLEAAIAGKCRFIVSGDRELLALGKFEGVNLLDVKEFLEIC